MEPITGFSKLSKKQKINWLVDTYLQGSDDAKIVLQQYWNKDAELQRLHDDFSENTISNYYMPFGVAPNFLINDQLYAIPMAIEESSVVAAASKAAKFWLNRGGFHTQILGNKKLGHVHFTFHGDKEKLKGFFNQSLIDKFKADTASITSNMQKRGGGILSIELIDKTDQIPDYFQVEAKFDTVDSMGANFINSCL
ncbi:MAG: hydroxymethylglutaryl-CoA reductase, partial [Weeksellaceae bacterium]